eukprot:Hpha_TRINITY_DN19297_c0_g1::TRINITY_DN19297_c0_g1_i1::g.194396::m.194396/K05012/CLCN3_4_5; chloride channel 3/4/5
MAVRLTPGRATQAPTLEAVPDGLKTKGRSHSPLLASVHDDWSTIDWSQEKDLADRGGRGHQPTWGKAWEETKGWVTVLLTGVTVGWLAGLIDTASEWLGDLKQGWCREFFWLSKSKCCPAAPSGTPAKLFHGKCAQWATWSQAVRHWPPGVVDCVGYVVIGVGYAVLCAWLVRTFAPYAAGSGIPEIKTILSGISIGRYLSGWTLLIKSVGLTLSVGSGMSLGKEGPFVHLASCVGSLWTGWFYGGRPGQEVLHREMLSASVAAGVAVAFGAPIGGVLFSLEEASYYFPHRTMWRAFVCAMAGVMVLKSIDPSHRGRLVMFQVDFNHPWHWFELPAFLVIGIVGGVIGALLNTLNVYWIRLRRRGCLQSRPVLEATLIALLSAIVNWNAPFMRGGATEFLAHLFQECRAEDRDGLCHRDARGVLLRLFSAASLKLFLTVVTFGIRIPAGLFVPSLFVGACVGRILGMWMKAVHGAYPALWVFQECHNLPDATGVCVVPGIYAIVGAAAVLGGVTRMTLSLVVMIVELTGRLEYLVPVMLAVIISKWVGTWVGGRQSIYELHIGLNGYPYLDPKREVSIQACCGDVMTSKHLKVVPAEGWTLREVGEMLDTCDFKGFPVISTPHDWRILGWVSRAGLLQALERAPPGSTTRVLFQRHIVSGMQSRHAVTIHEAGVFDASAFTDPTPMQVPPEMSINRLLHLFRSLGLRSCLATRHSQLQGIVTRKDLLAFLNEHDKDNDGAPDLSSSVVSAEAGRGWSMRRGSEKKFEV